MKMTNASSSLTPVTQNLSSVLRLSGVISTSVVLVLEWRQSDHHVLTLGLIAWNLVVVGISVWELARMRSTSRAVEDRLRMLTRRHQQLLDATRSLDTSFRQDVAAWLHGTVQGKLVSLARAERSRYEATLSEVTRLLVRYSESKSAANRKEITESIRSRLETCSNETLEALHQFTEMTIRHKSHEYFPPLLSVSLEAALRDLVGDRAKLHLDDRLILVKYSAETPEMLHEDSDQVRRTLAERRILSPDTRYRVYRIVEEALNNAEKKNATLISVSVILDTDEIVMRVRDNGAPLSEPVKRSFGLHIVEVITASRGGTWSLHNAGSEVIFEAKMRLSAEDAEFHSQAIAALYRVPRFDVLRESK